MTDLVERLARKLEPQAWAALRTGDTLAYENRRKSSIRKAMLCIEEMREPTPEMRAAAAYYLGRSIDISDLYSAMIDAALSLPSEERS